MKKHLIHRLTLRSETLLALDPAHLAIPLGQGASGVTCTCDDTCKPLLGPSGAKPTCDYSCV